MTKAIKKTIVTILLLCTALAFACFAACNFTQSPENPTNSSQNEQTENGGNNTITTPTENSVNGDSSTDTPTENPGIGFDDIKPEKKQKVTVSFVVDGSVFMQTTITSGEEIGFPPVPDKTGYVGEWIVPDLTSITTDITIYAVYTVRTYTLTFDYDGADGNNTQKTKTVTQNQPIGDLPMPTKDGFTFDGWQIDGKTITETTTWNIDGDKTAIAKWSIFDNGYSILSSNDFSIDGTKLTQSNKNYVFFDTEYDLRSRFTISKGAEWRAFTSADCSQPSEITTRKVAIEYGWNTVYIMVENKTTYQQQVYEMKIYKCPVLELGGDSDSYYIKKGVDFEVVIIPEEYNGKPITSIGYEAFKGCKNLTSIKIPDSVTSIGYKAFEGCNSLRYIKYENALYLGNTDNPYLCLIKAKSKDITSCTINENCKFIYDSAFYNCSSLTSVTIPNSVTSIGYYAFYDCDSLTSVTFENPNGWYVSKSSTETSSTNLTLTNASQNAKYLKSTYYDYYWKRK